MDSGMDRGQDVVCVKQRDVNREWIDEYRHK